VPLSSWKGIKTKGKPKQLIKRKGGGKEEERFVRHDKVHGKEICIPFPRQRENTRRFGKRKGKVDSGEKLAIRGKKKKTGRRGSICFVSCKASEGKKASHESDVGLKKKGKRRSSTLIDGGCGRRKGGGCGCQAEPSRTMVSNGWMYAYGRTTAKHFISGATIGSLLQPGKHD